MYFRMALPKSQTNSYPESEKLLLIENELCDKLEKIKFPSPGIECIYNPLKYASDLHRTFIKKFFENSKRKILFVGINPGPWGMSQNGIPFGNTNDVKDWMKISGSVEKPKVEHPEREIKGLNCTREEGSGKRFWELFRILCETPENFFKYSFVYNLCPLAFMDKTGKNITPKEIQDKTYKDELFHHCEEALIRVIEEFNFEIVIEVGQMPEKVKSSVKKAIDKNNMNKLKVLYIPHPSNLNVRYRKIWKLDVFGRLHKYHLMKYFIEQTNVIPGESEEVRIRQWMRISLGCAEKALKIGEVPVGCLFIYNNSIIAISSNTVNETKNATRHAEMNCIDEVLAWCRETNMDPREVFKEVEVVVTVEPCIMCCAALHELNIKHVIYGCGNYRFGGCSSVFDVPKVYNKSSCKVIGGIFAEEAINLLKEFYKGTNPNAPETKVKRKNKES